MFSKTYAVIGLFLCCSTAMFQPIFAQNSQTATSLSLNRGVETPTDKLVKIQRFLNLYSSIGKFSGVAILAQNGKPIHKFTTKYSTLDFKIRCALSTQFNTCDITQSFTATAVMQLVGQGKIDVKDKIGQYLFNLPPQIGQNITVHQLLTHTSGLKDYYNLKEYREKFYEIQDIETLVRMTSKYHLDFEPGTQFKKSTIGYLLLGNLIEQISGMSYRDYIQKNIFAPNNMSQSGLYSWFDTAEQRAVGYLSDRRGEPKEAPEYWGAHAFGADALHASVEDLLRFNNAFQGTMLPRDTRNQMLASHFTNPNTPNEHIGYGWKTKTINGQKISYQGGSLGGQSASIKHYHKDNYTVIILSNFGENTANIVADRIEAILAHDHTTVPNYPVGFILYELITEKGIDHAINNFDAIVQANDITIKDMWPIYSLGQDYMKENSPQTALKLFQLGAKKFPKAPMLYDAMGDCFHELGNKAMAKQSFEQKLRLAPNDQRAKRMLQVIESSTYANISEPQNNRATMAGNNTKQHAKPSPSNDQRQNTKTEKSLVSYPQKPTEKEHFVKTGYKPNPTPTKASDTFTDRKVYTATDIMPQFPGGQSALHQYIYHNMRYPTIAYINAIEGTVYADFIIDTYGNIVETQITTPIEGDDGGLKLEAMRLINNMPRWKPGSHQGQTVPVKMTIPIKFNKGNFMEGTIKGK